MTKEQLVKLMKNKKWLVQGFNGLPVYLHNVASNTGWMLKPVSGVNYSHFILRIHENRAKYYYDEADLQAIGNGYYKKHKKIKDLKILEKRHEKDFKKAYLKINKQALKNLDQYSLKELTILAQKISHQLTMSIGTSHSIEGISFISEHKLKEILNNRGLNTVENYQLLSSPIKASFLSQAQTKLWYINKAKGPKKEKLVENFLKYFGWIDNSYVRGKTLLKKDVLKKARHQKHLPSQTERQKTKVLKSKLIKSLKLTPEELFVINTIETCTIWQDNRKKFVMQIIGRFEPVIIELAKRLNMPLDVFKYIDSRELNYKSLTDKNFLKELYHRYPKNTSYALQNKLVIFSGKDEEYIENQLKTNDVNTLTEVEGMIACRGKVTGKVKLCLSIHDIPKVKEGEILIASMTRPEFLPAMQKAAAFVTDEGGITSHAAIVSREMNKPCIIGTKIATKIFKDGNMVEVDANKGTVRKL